MTCWQFTWLSLGSFFASCSTNQMFDSSTSGGDLYLEQGDIAQFEPPFLGSGWTVLCLADGGRGTAPRPAVEPVVPFYQWVTWWAQYSLKWFMSHWSVNKQDRITMIRSVHRWFLKSCAEGILVGDGKPSCDFPLQFGKSSLFSL